MSNTRKYRLDGISTAYRRMVEHRRRLPEDIFVYIAYAVGKAHGEGADLSDEELSMSFKSGALSFTRKRMTEEGYEFERLYAPNPGWMVTKVPVHTPANDTDNMLYARLRNLSDEDKQTLLDLLK